MITRTRHSRALARLTAVVLAALLVAACSGGASAGIKVSGPWARPSQAVAGAGAAYMVIENTGSAADALIGGSSPVARAVEVHETLVMGSAAPAGSTMPGASTAMGGMGSPAASNGGTNGGTMMGMQKVDRLEIPAGGKVELKPGGYHVMLIDLAQELKAGDRIEITLRFEKAGDVRVTAEVRAQ